MTHSCELQGLYCVGSERNQGCVCGGGGGTGLLLRLSQSGRQQFLMHQPAFTSSPLDSPCSTCLLGACESLEKGSALE